jgi:hypothetical protein
MKIRLWLVLAFVFGGFSTGAARADALFQLFWRVGYYTKNSTGHIINAGFSEQDFVNEVAQNTGMDPSQLILVYRPNKRDAAVVQKNGAFVASVIQMQTTYTDVVNPNRSVVVRHALLTDGSQSDPLGSFFGLELRSLNANGALLNDNLVGTVLYSRAGVVFGGQVSTGSRINDTTNAP